MSSTSLANFIKRIERQLGGLGQSDAEELQKLIGVLPLTWGILGRHPKAQRFATEVLLQVVRDPLYSFQVTDYMKGFHCFLSLRPVLREHFPAVAAEITEAVHRERNKLPPPPEHPRDGRLHLSEFRPFRGGSSVCR